jgi:hypothetical protein
MLKEERLLMESTATSNFDPPNFRTLIPLPVLLKGFRGLLLSLYDAPAFYDRCYRSLEQWKARRPQKPPEIPLWPKLGILVRSMLRQGLLSSYRKAYWKFLFRFHARWFLEPAKISLGFAMLLSGHHFIRYATTLAAQLEGELNRLVIEEETTEFSNEAAPAEIET